MEKLEDISACLLFFFIWYDRTNDADNDEIEKNRNGKSSGVDFFYFFTSSFLSLFMSLINSKAKLEWISSQSQLLNTLFEYIYNIHLMYIQIQIK